MGRCPTDLKEMEATVHAGCYWGHAARVMPLGRFWPVVGASAHPEPWAIHLLNAPEMDHYFEADHQRCCTEESFLKSMAMLLETLLPVFAHDVACRTGDDSIQHRAFFVIQCLLSSQQLLIALVQLLLLLRHKK